ncbi:MAG: hypothetical protein M3R27_12050 [Bacteroidota bacterium]|nr:hypothetical protein [Bacteroidota bacterium]
MKLFLTILSVCTFFSVNAQMGSPVASPVKPISPAVRPATPSEIITVTPIECEKPSGISVRLPLPSEIITTTEPAHLKPLSPTVSDAPVGSKKDE